MNIDLAILYFYYHYMMSVHCIFFHFLYCICVCVCSCAGGYSGCQSDIQRSRHAGAWAGRCNRL